MKKNTMIVTGILSTLTFGIAAGAFADNSLTEIKAFLNPAVHVNVSGNEIALKDEQGNQLTPLTYNDSIYLPLRGVAQSLGYQVYWDGTNHTALFQVKSDYLTFREDEKLIQDKYGYTLQIPSSLGGKVRPTIWPQEALEQGIQSGKLSQKVQSTTDILYLPKNPSSPASLMATVEVFKQADWADAPHDAQDRVLGSKGNYVYIIHNEQKNPFDPQSDDYPIYQQVVNQLSDNEYYLILNHAATGDPSIASQLIGKWTEQQKGTLMELTADGVLYRAGVAVGNYLILDSEHMKLVADKQVSTVPFKVDGDILVIAGQTFKRNN
ncbi:stalk domain-containing protein [Paenibacillus sp. GCM10027628]|uniref:stalk domain-containing protein n=1 Tax=Paenibacillus sp. GCM10027628 TaxID=3273413 RepID=UPI00362C4AF3